jgi:tetratricopeptide (TPR) repeat protein
MLMLGCASGKASKPRMAEGAISYPFIADTKPVGRAQHKQPFVIRSAVGSSEYTVEIPDNASRYDIQIPLAELRPKGSSDSSNFGSSDGKPINAGTTDKELVAALPALSKNKPNETAMMDAAFGMGSPEGPVQSPSYSLGIARVNQYFRERNFELSLVELNNLLAFYPNSPKLLKMKGTLLVKTGNRDLAMKSWQRASDLAPQDVALQRSIARLNERIVAEQNAQLNGRKPNEPSTIVPIAPSATEDILDKVAH